MKTARLRCPHCGHVFDAPADPTEEPVRVTEALLLPPADDNPQVDRLCPNCERPFKTKAKR